MTQQSQLTAAGPHQSIRTRDPRERFTVELLDRLWQRYRNRVAYVRVYEQIIADAGATLVNDHIALRTFAGQPPLTGMASISRIFEALGYLAIGCYGFPDKHLNAIHFQHGNHHFPKLFVSELKTWELSGAGGAIVQRAVQAHRDPLPLATLAELQNVDRVDSRRREQLLDEVVGQFHELPWPAPEKQDVMAIHDESQYAAWVLVHGYNVNHFTSLINAHGVAELDDIEKTAAALRRAGVPMKAEIEGPPASKLRQTATEAVTIDVDVRESGRSIHMPWTYAYFEMAERGNVADPEIGKPVRFEGFLGTQATNLFDMTKVK